MDEAVPFHEGRRNVSNAERTGTRACIPVLLPRKVEKSFLVRSLKLYLLKAQGLKIRGLEGQEFND